jgi:hypothetical protein
MIQIIPIDINKEDYDYISNITKTQIEKTSSFITSISLITKLVNIMKYPIRNKWIAIYNILSFLNHLDNTLKMSKKTTLPISTEIFIEYFNRNEYKEYTKLLQELDILTKVPYDDGKFYQYGLDNGNKCIQYRVHNNYIKDDICMVIFEDNDKLELEKDNNYNKKMEKTILKTQINYKNSVIDEIKNYKENCFFQKEESLFKLKCRLSAILQLTNRRFIKKGIKVDRIYNSFSNLSKISRKHLHIKGTYFKSIDIKNCQPLLLSYYILQTGGVIDDLYLDNCEEGILYETLMDEELIKDMTKEQYEEYRNSIKVQTYKNIYFNLNKNADITIRFANLYPNVYYFLDNYYQHNLEETMASNLQNIEASIFNNIVAPKSIGYYTLFDAIYFTDDNDIDFIFSTIKEEFSKLNINPSLKLN